MPTAVSSQRPSNRQRNAPAGTSARVDGGEPLRRRARQLLRAEIDFIPNRAFRADNADSEIGSEREATYPEAFRETSMPNDLPGHLSRLCEAKLLSAEEETRLFRRMNYLKFKANGIRRRLDAECPTVEAVDRIDELLGEANQIRDRIVQSNVRLAMSVVKKFVTPQQSFDDLLSDGIYSLMQATEKFDYDRGFRFSTYAYRAIARNAFRRINERQKETARFPASSEEAVLEVADDRESSATQDAAWERLRGLLTKFMGRLDRRERLIVRSRYALGAHRKVRTFQSLADRLGVSKERVRQLEQRAVAKLQRFAAEHKIETLVGSSFG